MATNVTKPMDYRLVKVGVVELEDTRHEILYRNIAVLSTDTLILRDYTKHELWLYNRHSGKLLAIYDKIEDPWDICVMDDTATKIAVTLKKKGRIQILSVESMGQSSSIKLLDTLDVSRRFCLCYGLGFLRSEEKLVVSGVKVNENKDPLEHCFCWGLVSIKDGQIGTLHEICKNGYGHSHVAISKDNSLVYITIASHANSRDNGVYAFDVTSGEKKFVYCRDDMNTLNGICVDRMGFIYVCNRSPPCILQLTQSLELVTMHTESIPQQMLAMCMVEQQGELYVTTFGSKWICRLHLEWGSQQDLPPEVQHMDQRDLQLYREALTSGSKKVDNIRLMVIGHQGVGKTSLVKRLLGEEVKKNDTKGTESIDFYHLEINHDTKEWSKIESDRVKLNRHSLLEVLRKHDTSGSSKSPKGAENSSNDGNSILRTSNGRSGKGNTEPGIDDIIYKRKDKKEKRIKTFETDPEIRQLVNEAQSFTLDDVRSSPLSIMDFAGQFLYYTTHQTFMSWRTIYLLVTNMNLSLGDPVRKDLSGLNVSDYEPRSIQDHVVYWLNSVHSHVFLPIALDHIQGNVILVGTHLDEIPKSLVDDRRKEHFENIRELLKDRPLRYHLVDADFAITNIEPDATIDVLRQKIFDLAQKQDYWGTPIPARWLALENALLKLAREGKKVIPYSEVEILNESLEVYLESREALDAFLKFEHELGHCIFFGAETLRAHVILDPQWLIEGLKVWIHSDDIIKQHPELSDQWYNFRRTGRLTEELIELLWSKHPELHEHQKHLLSVMEKLNIIAKAPVKDDHSAQEKFYWVPCMVQMSGSDYSKTIGEGENVIMTPALCFVSTTKFIHVGVFHRLLASCLTKWQPCKKGYEYLIFSGLCEFELNKDHVLVLSLNDYVIQANVIRYSKRNVNPELSLCITIREGLFTTLREIADQLCPACDFDIYIKCTKTSPLSNEGLHKIKDLQENLEIRCAEHKRSSHCIRSDYLLGFWEGKGANVPTIVQTAESVYATNRFMKIYSLLVDLGSKVLRHLLNDKVAQQNLTLDQYLQQKKTDIESLQIKKILLKVQMDIIFPTNGHTDPGKYDIALSSALLMNIFPPLEAKETQKITDIRDERNKLTHAQSTKMSNSEFQIKWTKVTTTLTDLSKLCHDINFTADIQRGIQEIEDYGSEDINSVFEKYNEDIKREMDARLDKYNESQKKEIEVMLDRCREDLNNHLKAEMDTRIGNLKVDLTLWLDKQITGLKTDVQTWLRDNVLEQNIAQSENIVARLDKEKEELKMKMNARLNECKKRYLEN